MLLRSRLGCPGRRRSAAQRLLLLVPCLWLWSAISYVSRSLILSTVVDFPAVGRSSSGSGRDSDYATGPVAAATIALCCCAGCTVTVSAILAVLLRRRRDTERSWHHTALHWLTAGLGGATKIECGTTSSRREETASKRCTPAPGLVLNLLALAFCHAAVTLCELIAMTSPGSCSCCSATVSVEPLAAATLQAVLADVVDAAVATATVAGAAGEPLTSAALLGLPLASYGAVGLLSGDEQWRWTQLESYGGGRGGSLGLVLAGIATIARLARNLLLRASYGRLDAAAAAAANGRESSVPAARLSLFAAMNAAACLWLFPVAAALRALGSGGGDQWRFAAGLHPGAVVAATLLSGVGSMMSLLIMLPKLTLTEHATARLVKNTLVAMTYAAIANDETLGSREAAAFMLVAVGVIVFVAGGGYSERGGTGALSNRHLQTPQCILAAICFAALLFNHGTVNSTTATAVVHNLKLESGPCEAGRIPSAAAAVFTSLTNAQAALAILPPSSPPSSEADSIEIFRLKPVPSPNGTSLVAGNTQSPSAYEATSPRLLPDILTDEPVTIARFSNELRSVDALVAEARRLLDTLLGNLFTGRRRAVLVNLFSWPNKGDHLITIAELRLLERHNVSVVHACMFPARNCRFERVPRGSDLIILLQGGGYSGHPDHQGAFNNVIRSFPDQRVVLLPNSLCYPTSPCDAAALSTFASSLLNHSDFHVLLRDAYSYETTRRTVDDLADNDYRVGGLGGPWLYLSPDVAWAVESLVVNVAPVYDIVWLKRQDWESVDSDAMPLIPQGLRVQIIDWVDSWMGQKGANYWEHLQLRALSGVAFLSRGRVVISDRLHAHIMSQLMRKPNVLINSKTKKQGHYYETWERSVETSRLASNNNEALALAQELLLQHGGPVTLPQVNPVEP